MLVTIKHLFTSLTVTPFELEILASASASMCSDRRPTLKRRYYVRKSVHFFFEAAWQQKDGKKGKEWGGKAINAYERTVKESRWHRVTHGCRRRFFISSSLIHPRSLSAADKLSFSPRLLSFLKNYIKLFTRLHAWHCDCQSASL